jgi:peptide/nickel transport system substrate-binding protein
MKLKTKRLIGIVLAFILCVGMLSGCTPKAVAGKSTITTPLVVAYDPFNGKFSPFFGDTAYDMDVAGMTQVGLMTTDRNGGVIYNAIKGETGTYNGTEYLYKGIADLAVTYDEKTDTTVYRATIRNDVPFSDGHMMDIDDVIFSYYVLCDPSYVGSTTLSSFGIIGLQNYQTQTTDAVYEKYSAMVQDIYAAGEAHVWSDADSWTQAQQDGFWALVNEEWKTDVNAIVAYVTANYLSYAEQGYFPFTGAEIGASAEMQIAFAMRMWGFASVDGKVLTTAVSGKSFDMAAGEFPTLDDFFDDVKIAYEGDNEAYWAVEAADDTDVISPAISKFIFDFGSQDESMGGEGIKNIAGIKRVNNRTVEVTTKGYESSAIYSILGISVAPMHYYGDESLYDYKNNSFGFPFGDLTSVEAKTSNPMGAGAYKFVKYEDKVVYFEANEYYYKGCPKVQYIQFKEVGEADKISALASGAVDVANPSGSKIKFQEIRDKNSNGELDGDVITTNSVDNLGYGYIGINADTVKVGSEAASAESKNLRKALATLLAVYRDVAINSYYGDAASVINYPISNTSWAAPQKSDADYKVAFSLDVDGNAIYTDDMDAAARYEAALKASIGFFKAAGYTFNETTKKFTAAPDGASLTYEALIPGDGLGDHPNFQVLTNTAEALKSIGITLEVNDLAESSVLWERLDAGTQELWTAAWGATIDPDMYQVYHSSGIVGLGGSDSNHYHIADATLDEQILAARQSDDQTYRKSVYKACLDIILDWAVEVPSYQRQNIIIFSTARVNIDTVTPDITTYWGWMNDIELLEVYENAAE